MSCRLSVCLLTRNEEANIERVLRSVQGFTDEVVVADTGSTDRTVEFAKAMGARVTSVSWDDDFSEGRNVALRQATGDWILWLNPDEEWIAPPPEALRSLIATTDRRTFGYLARVRSIPREEQPTRFSETWDFRLYRRRPDLRYTGRLHPTLSTELSKAVTDEGGLVRPSEILIRHLAYRSVLNESKLRWALRLLERELQDRPGQLRYLTEYGRNLLLIGDRRGHDVMAEALKQLEPTWNDPNAPLPHAQILLEYALTTAADLNRSSLGAEQAQALALRWFPNSPPLLWAIAESFFRSQQFPAAAVLLEHLVQLGASGAYDHSFSFDPRIVGPVSYTHLDVYKRQEQAQALALRWFPNSPPLLWAIAESFFRSQQFPAAAVLLEHLVQLGASGAYDHSFSFDPRIVGPWPLLNLGQIYRALGKTTDARRIFESLLSDPEFHDQAVRHIAELENSTSASR